MIRLLISSAIASLMILGPASLFAETENTGTAAPASAPPSVPANTAPSIGDLFRNISPKDIPGNVIKIISDDWMLISAGTKDKFNSMTAGWGGFGVMWGKPVAFILVRNTRYTYEFLEKEDSFTLSFFEEKYRPALKIFGTKSGRDTDKVKLAGFTPMAAAPGMAYSEARMIVVCKKIYGDKIKGDCATDPVKAKSLNATEDYHKLYFGEITDVWVKKE